MKNTQICNALDLKIFHDKSYINHIKDIGDEILQNIFNQIFDHIENHNREHTIDVILQMDTESKRTNTFASLEYLRYLGYDTIMKPDENDDDGEVKTITVEISWK